MAIPEKGIDQKQLTVVWMIWGAMFVTLFIYVLICHLVGEGLQVSLNPDFPLTLLRNILVGVGIFTLFLAHFVRKLILAPPSDPAATAAAQPPPLREPSWVMGKYTQAMIISLAFCESIGIYGLVLFFLGKSFQTLYILVGISALGMFHYRPRRDEIEKLLNAI